MSTPKPTPHDLLDWLGTTEAQVWAAYRGDQTPTDSIALDILDCDWRGAEAIGWAEAREWADILWGYVWTWAVEQGGR